MKKITKTYRYRGYSFRKTDVTTDGMNNKLLHCYEIDGLKPVGAIPLLTSIKACKEFIDEFVNE